jgi:hypothetical protein
MAGQEATGWDDRSVEALLAVANTRHGPGAHRGRAQSGWTEPHDHLSDGKAALAYLKGRMSTPSSPPSTDELVGLRKLRDLAWRLWEDEPDAEWESDLEGLLRRAHYQLVPSGEIRPADAGWGGLMASALPGLISLRTQRERLKRCENPRCGWLFVDRSRNRSRRWCEMATCGNRAKAKRHAHRADG